MGVELGTSLKAAVGDHVPGIAAAIVDREGIREAAAVGSADLTSGRPASVDMVCPWFSMTKIVTATAAMRLAERGILDLDAPIAPHVPQMRYLRPAGDAARITARHLLSHSAGLANPIPVSWIHPADRPGPDPDAFLDRLLSKHAKLRFEPGAKSSYSNLGTLTLGAAMANLTGTPFVDLIEVEVVEPLKMTSTGFAYTPDLEARAAVGYHPRRSPMRWLLPRWVIGAPVGRWVGFNRFALDGQAYGGLIGSVTDAARFLQMHLLDGELEGHEDLGARLRAGDARHPLAGTTLRPRSRLVPPGERPRRGPPLRRASRWRSRVLQRDPDLSVERCRHRRDGERDEVRHRRRRGVGARRPSRLKHAFRCP